MHWIESRQKDPASLKEEFLFLTELELIWNALLLGVIIGALFSALDDAMVESFRSWDVGTFGFWAAAFGCILSLFAFVNTSVSYITLFVFLPVHPVNFYVYVKTSSVQHLIKYGTFLLLSTAYVSIGFLACATLHHIGSNWLALALVFGLLWGFYLCT